MMYAWVPEARGTVYSDNIIHRFKKCHITNTSNGRRDEVFWKYVQITEKVTLMMIRMPVKRVTLFYDI